MPPLPQQGQVVNVRVAMWALAEVRQQGLPRSPADEAETGLTHVVDPQSLEEDRLGEEPRSAPLAEQLRRRLSSCVSG